MPDAAAVVDRACHQGSVLAVAGDLEHGPAPGAVPVGGRVAPVLVVARAASVVVRAVARLVVASVDVMPPSPVREPAVVATSRAGAQERLAVSRWALPRSMAEVRTTGHRGQWEDRPPALQVQARPVVPSL